MIWFKVGLVVLGLFVVLSFVGFTYVLILEGVDPVAALAFTMSSVSLALHLDKGKDA